MANLLKKANNKLPIGWAAAILAVSFALSFILGFLRDRLLATNFGVGPETDAYYVAFTVPDFMYFILTTGALSVAFIPVLNERLITNNKKSAWELSSSLLNLLSMITLVAAIFIMLFADVLVRNFIAPGLNEEAATLAVIMMRIIAINPFLFAISSVVNSVQQAVGRFFFYAMAPLFYSVGIIFGIIVLGPIYGIIGVAYGVVLGALAQLIVSLFGMVGIGFKYKGEINWKNKGFRKVLRLLPPRSFDQGIDYFITLVEVSIASRLGAGLITAYQFAYKMHYAPVTLIGVAISTAVFPRMSERINQGRPDLFRKELREVIRVIIWISLPIAMVTFFTRGYLSRFMIAGVDQGEDRDILASILGLLAIAIFFRSLFHIASRSFYAQQDTKTPLYVSIFALFINVGLAIYLGQTAIFGVYGLAIAQSVTAMFEVLVLFTILSKRHPGIFEKTFFSGTLRMIAATALTSVVTYVLVKQIPLRVTDVGFFTLVPKFVLIVAISLTFYVAVSNLFALKEAKPVVNRLLKVVFKPVKI